MSLTWSIMVVARAIWRLFTSTMPRMRDDIVDISAWLTTATRISMARIVAKLIPNRLPRDIDELGAEMSGVFMGSHPSGARSRNAVGAEFRAGRHRYRQSAASAEARYAACRTVCR